MSPDKFLSFAVRQGCHRKSAWLLSLFAVVQESDKEKNNIYPGKLITEPFGFFFYDESLNKVKIDTSRKITEPLFQLKDPLVVTRDLYPSLKVDKLESTVGRYFLNYIVIHEVFGHRLEYINKKFSPNQIEVLIYPLIKDNPVDGEARDENAIYVDDYVRCGKAVTYIESFSDVFVETITEVGLRPAPGRKQFKKELLTKYEGKLNDPVEMAKFEAELEKFDSDYLKQDPSYGNFMSGKVKAARMAAYLTQGGVSNGFTESMEVTPVIQSLEDGVSTDQKGFVAQVNEARFGSFSRGAETINGGVVAKDLLRAADNWKIVKGDCGTKNGIQRKYNKDDIRNLVGRYLLLGGKSVLIETEEQASKFTDKEIIVRSPQYCSKGKTNTCEVCAGLALSKFPDGLTIPLTEVSGGILSDSLKLMHNTKLEAVEVNLESVIS